MSKKVQIEKTLLRELIEYAVIFDDISMSSYYATDTSLQEMSKELNELIYKIEHEVMK